MGLKILHTVVHSSGRFFPFRVKTEFCDSFLCRLHTQTSEFYDPYVQYFASARLNIGHTPRKLPCSWQATFRFFAHQALLFYYVRKKNAIPKQKIYNLLTF